MADPPFDLGKAHRWFAVECNNRAWDLVEAESLTETEQAELIQVAHASRYHWQFAGDALNHLRGEYLLATAYLRAQRGEPALHHAQLAQELVNALRKEGEFEHPFDEVCVLACLAQGGQLQQQTTSAESHLKQARKLLAKCTDAGERELLLKLYPALR